MSDIDARDFGRVAARVEALQNEVHSLSKDVKALLELANQSKGGFWMGMTIASTVGGILTYVGERLFK